MAIKEQDKVFYEEAENGDKVINLPVTRVNNVEGLGRSANTAYVVGDVVYVDNNKKVALKCTQAGTTSDSELNVSTASIGNVITDGSVVWQVCNRTSDVTSVNGKTGDVVVDLPVGHMHWSVEPNVPAGRLPALGATYNRSLYADLWNWANERGLVKSESEWQAIASANGGNCAYYSEGDGSTTFRVPKLPTTIVTDASDGEIPVVGNGMALGITDGKNFRAFGIGSSAATTYSGIGYGASLPAIGTSGGASWDTGAIIGVTSDSSKSGIVAKTSATKITGQWLIVAFGVAHNIGEADVANVMSAVEQVQTSVGTLEQGVGTAIDYIVESYRNGTEWYEVYKSGKIRQGGSTASSNYGIITVSLLKPFKDTKYGVYCQTNYDGNYFTETYEMVRGKETTSFLLGKNNGSVDWIAEGQGV